MLGKKDIYWKLCRRFRTNALYDEYKGLSELCTKAVSNHVAGVEYVDGKIGNYYKYINKKLNGSNDMAPLLNSNGVLISNPVMLTGLCYLNT